MTGCGVGWRRSRDGARPARCSGCHCRIGLDESVRRKLHPLAASDGSVRLLCYYSEGRKAALVSCGEQSRLRIRGLDGHRVGWPPGHLPNRHQLRSSTFRHTDGRGLRRPHRYRLWTTSRGSRMSYGFVEIRPQRQHRLGARIPAPIRLLLPSARTASRTARPLSKEEGLELRTQLVAFDAHGMRPGWPIVVDGISVSHPSFGPNGQLVTRVLDRRWFTDCPAESGWIRGGALDGPRVLHRMVARRRRAAGATGRRSRTCLGGRRGWDPWLRCRQR